MQKSSKAYGKPKASKKPRSGGSTSRGAKYKSDDDLWARLQQVTENRNQNSRPSSNNSNPVNDMLTARLENKEQMFTSFSKMISQLQADESATVEALKQKVTQVEQLEADNEHLTSQLNEARENECHAAQLCMDLKEKIIELQDENQSTSSQLENLNQSVAILNEDIREQSAQWNSKEVKFLQAINNMEAENSQLKLNINEMSQKYQTLEKENEKRKTDLKQMVETYKSETQNGQQNVAMLTQRGNSLEREKKELTNHLRGASKELENNKQLIKEHEKNLESQARAFEKSKRHFSSQLEDAMTENSQLQSTIGVLQQQAEQFRERLEQEMQTKQTLNSELGSEIQKYAEQLEAMQYREQEQEKRHEEEIQTLKTEIEAGKDEQAQLQRKLRGCNDELKEMGAEVTLRVSENEQLRQISQASLSDLEKIQPKYEEMKRNQAQMQQTMSDLAEINEQVEDRLKHLCIALDRPETDCLENIENWVSEAHQRIQGATALQHEYDSMKNKNMDVIKSQNKEIETMKQQLEEANANLEGAKKDAAQLAKHLQQQQQAVALKTRQFDDTLKEKHSKEEELRSTLGADVMKFQRSIENQKLRIQSLEAEKMELLQEAETLNSELSTIRREKAEADEAFEKLTFDASATNRQLEDSERSKKEAQNTVDDLQHQLSQIQNEIQENEWAKKKEMQEYQHDLNEKKQAFENEKTTMEKELQVLAQEVQQQSNIRTALETSLKEKQSKLEEAARAIVSLRDDLSSSQQHHKNEEVRLRRDIETVQHQVKLLGNEKERIEVSLNAAKSHNEQLLKDLSSSREDKRSTMDSLHEVDKELVDLRTQVAQSTSDLERMTKSRNQAKDETDRATKEYNDLLRQFEVTRRNTRSEKSQHAEQMESLKLDLASTKQQILELTSHSSELQMKLANTQNASNATINELMTELKTCEESLRVEKTRTQRELEKYRNQMTAMEEEVCRREGSHTQALQALRQENRLQCDIADDAQKNTTKLQQQADSRRKENERLTKEVQEKEDRLNELNRSVSSLKHSKQLAEDKVDSLKQTLDSKVKEYQNLEDELRSQIDNLKSEKRESEVASHRLRDEYESKQSLTSTEQQTLREYQVLKTTFDRTKAELLKSSNELTSLHERLDQTQAAANAQIAELKSNLLSNDQENQTKIMDIQRELELEREKRIILENEKARISHRSASDNINWDKITGPESGRKSSRIVLDALPQEVTRPETTSARSGADEGPIPFHETEQGKLADMPLSLIKAQVQIDLASPAVPSPKSKPRKHEVHVDSEDPHYMGTRTEQEIQKVDILHQSQHRLKKGGSPEIVPQLEFGNLNNNSSKEIVEEYEYDRESAVEQETLNRKSKTTKSRPGSAKLKARSKAKKTPKGSAYGTPKNLTGKKRLTGLPKI